jgi:hypothetical protein
LYPVSKRAAGVVQVTSVELGVAAGVTAAGAAVVALLAAGAATPTVAAFVPGEGVVAGLATTAFVVVVVVAAALATWTLEATLMRLKMEQVTPTMASGRLDRRHADHTRRCETPCNTIVMPTFVRGSLRRCLGIHYSEY